MRTWTFDSPDPETTLECAAELGRSIGEAGLAIALVGPLGAGKTVFVKGLATGLGVDPRLVSSPTFVIAQQYRLEAGPEVLHHLDLYRLESELELESIGFYDMLAPGAVLAVEWADRFPGVLGSEHLTVEFEGPSADAGAAAHEEAPAPARRARVRAEGARVERVLADWAARVDGVGESDDASGSGGGATASSPQMRALLLLLVAMGLFGLGRLATWIRFAEPVPTAACSALVELEADALGTLSARCARPDELGAATATGIGRLLEGQGLDLNRAPEPWLQSLPEIGPARAAAIARTRAVRPFSDVSDLERTPGIGSKIRARVEPWLYVGAAGGDGDDG